MITVVSPIVPIRRSAWWSVCGGGVCSARTRREPWVCRFLYDGAHYGIIIAYRSCSGTYQSISIYYRLSDLPNKFSFNIPYTDTVRLFCDACSGVRHNFMHIHFNVYNNDAMDVARRSQDRKASQYGTGIKFLVMHSVPLCSCYWPSRGMHQRFLIGRTTESIHT